MQTKIEQQLANGLSYLVTYTWSKTMSNSGDLLNGSPNEGYRAPYVPGAGPKFDWGPADFDIRNVFHLSGTYELPFGKNKKYMANAGKLGNSVFGGWSVNALAIIQGGQPIYLSCPSGTTSGTGCNDLKVPGQSQKLGLKTKTDPTTGKIDLFWFGNPAAFNQPCLLGG